MIATANKKSINKLAIRTLKTNKMRNIFAIIAIALTTILFTSLFTISMSMVNSMERSTMRQSGGSCHGAFKQLTSKEFKRIKSNNSINEYGYSIMLSHAENKELATRLTEICYGTKNDARFRFSLPTKGRMPKKKNEIAADTIVLDLLGIQHKIGEKITLTYPLKGKECTNTFMLSGYWKSDDVSKSSTIWISRYFLYTQLVGFSDADIKKGIKQGDYTGAINLDVMFSNSFNIKNNMKKVIKQSGYTEKEIKYGVNWAYLSTNFEPDFESSIILIVIVGIILLSGYLIIYNIFYISVAKDTKFYGMLKTIGTTSKQIKVLVKRQAVFLSAIGIPIGLIIGYILGSMLVPFAVGMTTADAAVVSSNPIIFAGSALFAFITVVISCSNPAKIASKISPIEAIRYVEISKKNKKKIKRSFNGAKLHKMALNNIFRNKIKAIVVLLSLSLSIILFNGVYTITKSFSINKYLSLFITSDFAIADAGYFNMINSYSGENTLTEQVVQEIGNFKGIKGIGRVYFKEMNKKVSNKDLKWLKKVIKTMKDNSYIDENYIVFKNREIPMHFNGIDKFVWNKIKLYKGKFDAKKFATGRYIIISSPAMLDLDASQSYYDIGDSINITFDDGSKKSYKVMAIGEAPWSISARYSEVAGLEAYVPSEEFRAHIKNPTIMTAIFDVRNKYINYEDAYLANYVKAKKQILGYESRKALEKEFDKALTTFKLIGGSLSFIIALIGILNFINSMATSIISRKRENAMLQSIGMTDKQLYKMLIFEGIYYAVFTIIISIILSSAFNYFVLGPVALQMWFLSYSSTLLPIAICAPILINISAIVPIICYKTSNDMSIVERLGEAE